MSAILVVSTGENGIGSRHHDLTRNRVPKREDALDHLPFIFGNQSLLLTLVDQLLDFFFDVFGFLDLGKPTEAHLEPMLKTLS